MARLRWHIGGKWEGMGEGRGWSGRRAATVGGVDGHSSAVPWLCQGRAGRSRAQASPRQEKSLAKRARCRGNSVCEHQVSPALPDVHGPPSRRALAFLGSGFGGSSVSAAESAPRQLASLPNGIASLQGPSELRQGALPADCTAGRGLARPGTTVSWLPMPQHPMRLPFCYAAYRRVRRRRATASGSPTAREQSPARRLPVRV